MIDRAKSEELMLAREAAYIAEIKQIEGTSPEVLATMAALYRAGWRDCWEAEAINSWDEGTVISGKVPRTIPQSGDVGSWLETIWSALHGYRQDCIPEGDPAYDDEWGDITTAMAWIEETLLDAEKTS